MHGSNRNKFKVGRYSPGLTMFIALLFVLFVAGAYVVKVLTTPWADFEALCIQDRWLIKYEGATPDQKFIKSMRSDLGAIHYFDENLHCSAISTDTFEEYNRLKESFSRAAMIGKAGQVTIVFEDDTEHVFPVYPGRSIDTIDAVSWLILFEGILFLLIGVWVWRFHRRRIEYRLFMLASIGVCFALFSMFLVSEMTFFISGREYNTAVFISRTADKLAAYSFALLLGVYPIPLITGRTIFIVYSFLTLLVANEYFKITDLPVNTFESQYVIAVVLGLTFSFLQYRKSEGRLAARIVTKVLIYSVVLSNSLQFLVYVLPGIVGSGQSVSMLFSCIFVAILYIGILIGLFRYRLFDMEKWWFKIWLWFFSGLVVLIVDILLIALFDLSHNMGLVMSILLAGWIYFPFRQYLLRKMNWTQEITFENQFPKILESIFSNQDYNKQWKEIMIKIFNPLNYQKLNNCTDSGGVILDDGEKLSVPTLGKNQRIVLSYAGKGTRLFNQNDVATADLFFNVFQRCCELQNIQAASTRRERERIMRDLHDDVGGKLVLLVHRLKDDNKSLARDTLKSLKDSIYTLDDSAQMPLVYVIYNIQADLQSMLGGIGVELQWRNRDDISEDFNCSPRKKVNLSKIIKEAVINALKHANPSLINVTTQIGDAALHLSIRNNGTISIIPENWKSGKGLANMAARAAEIDSRVSYKLIQAEAQGSEEWVETLITIPLNESIENENGSHT